MSQELLMMKTIQDALVIVLDYSSEKDYLKQRFSNQFKDSRQYFILDGNNIQDENTIITELLQRKEKQEVYLPISKRLILFFYIPVDRIRSDWIEQYYRIAEVIERDIPVRNGQHLFVPCIFYEKVKHQKVDKNSISKDIASLYRPNTLFAHTQYFLYCGFTDKLDGQLQAMIWLLHMWSRKEFYKVNVINPFEHSNRSQLKVINGTDYDEVEVIRCQKEIEEIEDWEEKSNDRTLSGLYDKLKTMTDNPIRKLKEELEEFGNRIGLYPAKESDYSSGGFFRKRERLITVDHPMLIQRKLHSVRTLADRFLDEPDKKMCEEIIHFVTDGLYYHDIKLLADKVTPSNPYEKCQLHQEVMDRIPGFSQLDLEIQRYVKRWYEQIETLLKKVLFGEKPPVDKGQDNEMMVYLDHIFDTIEDVEIKQYKWYEKESAEKSFRKAQLIERKEQAGRYTDITDCLREVSRKTSFLIPQKLIPKGRETILLVAGRCMENWSEYSDEIQDIDNCVAYYDIAPSQVVLIKTGDLLNLDDANIDYSLGLIM